MSVEERTVYEFGPFRLDAAERLLLRDGSPVALPPKAFHTLEALVRRSGRLVEKDELLREIWPDSFVEEANLSMNVSAVRRALGEEAGAHQYIETVPKRGYRFVAPVRVLSGEHAAGNGNGNGSNGARHVSYAYHVEALDDDPTPEPPEEVAVAAPERRRVWRAIALVAGLAALVGITVAVTLAVSGRLSDRPPEFDFQRMKISKVAGTARVDRAVVSPDGKYLAQIVAEGGRASLSIRQLATTRTVEIVPASDAFFDGVSFTPDGTSIYYVTANADGSTAYRIPALGGRTARVAEGVDRAIAVSPDGSRIAYVGVDYDEPASRVVVAAADGSDARTILARPDGEIQLGGNAAWSPDGRRIVCVDYEPTAPNRQGLLAVDPVDGSTHEVGDRRWKIIERICWLPDGSGLLIAALPEGSMGQPFQIWFVSYPSGDVRRVTNDLTSYLDLSVTSDGTTLVATQSSSHSRIDVVDVDDPETVARRLAPGSSMLDGVQGLLWAPNGRIVYLTWGSGNTDIWSMNADGTGAVQVTDDPFREWWPDVSADGRYVVYSANRGNGLGLWRVESEGGQPIQLTQGAIDGHPMCASDGWVYFLRRSGETSSVFKVPIAGGDAVEAFGASLQTPALSPDGTMVAGLSLSGTSPATEMRVVSTRDGRELRRFQARHVYLWNGLRWAPNGGGLAYISASDGVTNVWLQPLDGGAPRQLTNFNADSTVNAAWSPDGRRLACTRVSANTIVVTITDFR